MMFKPQSITTGLFLLIAMFTASAAQASEDLRLQVEETETAFAKTMADRDFDAAGCRTRGHDGGFHAGQ